MEIPNFEPGLSFEAFTIRIRDLLAKRYPEGKAELLPEEPGGIKVTFPDDRSGIAYVDNIFRNYELSEGESCEEEVERFLGLLSEPAAPAGREALVATVRHRDLMSFFTEQHGDDPSKGLLSRPLVGDLIVVLAFDYPDRIQMLMEEDLEELGATRDALFEEAAQNVLSPLEIERHGDGPVYMLTAGGCYEASLLLDVKLWQHLGKAAAGELLACVPSRDIVLYADSAEEDARDLMETYAADMFESGSHTISTDIYRFTGSRWVET
tara:strand:+ start:262 stop:1059 length:798 start_codon:yes stop_codon:yes gene_type:complete